MAVAFLCNFSADLLVHVRGGLSPAAEPTSSPSHSTDKQTGLVLSRPGKTFPPDVSSALPSTSTQGRSLSDAHHECLRFSPSTADTVRDRLPSLVPPSFLFPTEEQTESAGETTTPDRERRNELGKQQPVLGKRLVSEDLRWTVHELLKEADLLWQELSRRESLLETTLQYIARFLAEEGKAEESEEDLSVEQGGLVRNGRRLDEGQLEGRKRRSQPEKQTGLRKDSGKREADESRKQLNVRRPSTRAFSGFRFQDFELTTRWLWKKVTSQFNYKEQWDLHTQVPARE